MAFGVPFSLDLINTGDIVHALHASLDGFRDFKDGSPYVRDMEDAIDLGESEVSESLKTVAQAVVLLNNDVPWSSAFASHQQATATSPQSLLSRSTSTPFGSGYPRRRRH